MGHSQPPIVTIFGSSRPQPDSAEYELARSLGRALAERGFVICNGGYAGTMEAAARGARDAGGRTIGVTCDLFTPSANQWITEEMRTPRLVDRILKLAELGSAYVILPGGTGTLLELAFVLEAVNKGFSDERPIVLLGPFWEPVLEPLKEEMKGEGLMHLERFLKVLRGPEEAAAYLSNKLESRDPKHT